MRLLLIAALSLTALTADAQSTTLSGVWAVVGQGAQGTTPEGGNWSLAPISGTLTLEQKGKDVSGTWKGQMPEPWTISGHIDGRSFDLRSEWREIQISRDGAPSTARARWLFHGEVDGNSASGSMGFELEKGTARPQPFKATRTP